MFPHDPSSQLDRLGPLRRAIMGMFSFVATLFAAAAGLLLMFGPGWAGWGFHIVGDMFLFVAAFFLFVAARFWLGKNAWVDRVVNVMFAKAYWYVLAIVLLFVSPLFIGLTISLWRSIHRH